MAPLSPQQTQADSSSSIVTGSPLTLLRAPWPTFVTQVAPSTSLPFTARYSLPRLQEQESGAVSGAGKKGRSMVGRLFGHSEIYWIAYSWYSHS